MEDEKKIKDVIYCTAVLYVMDQRTKPWRLTVSAESMERLYCTHVRASSFSPLNCGKCLDNTSEEMTVIDFFYLQRASI